MYFLRRLLYLYFVLEILIYFEWWIDIRYGFKICEYFCKFLCLVIMYMLDFVKIVMDMFDWNEMKYLVKFVERFCCLSVFGG